MTEANTITAEKIVQTHTWYAAGVGLVPVPVFDMAALTAVNLRMVHELSKAHGVEFKEDRVKAALASLAAGLGAGLLAQNAVATGVLRFIPLVGQTIATVRMSLFGAAFTYAVGSVFTRHFATGGTLLDFDAAKTKQYFSEQFEKGKQRFRRTPPVAPESAAAAAEPTPATA